MRVSIVIRLYRQQIDGTSRKKIVNPSFRKQAAPRFFRRLEGKPKVSLRQHAGNFCMISVIRSIFLAGSDKIKAKWSGVGLVV
jgi:hypothetical protein